MEYCVSWPDLERGDRRADDGIGASLGINDARPGSSNSPSTNHRAETVKCPPCGPMSILPSESAQK